MQGSPECFAARNAVAHLDSIVKYDEVLDGLSGKGLGNSLFRLLLRRSNLAGREAPNDKTEDDKNRVGSDDVKGLVEFRQRPALGGPVFKIKSRVDIVGSGALCQSSPCSKLIHGRGRTRRSKNRPESLVPEVIVRKLNLKLSPQASIESDLSQLTHALTRSVPA